MGEGHYHPETVAQGTPSSPLPIITQSGLTIGFINKNMFSGIPESFLGPI